MLPPFSALVAVEKAWPRRGANAEAADHRLERQHEVLEPLDRRLQLRRAGLPVDGPGGLIARGQPAHGLGVHHVPRQRRAGPAGGAVGRHADDLDLQRVARLGALDEDRPVHRVRPGPALHAVLVGPAGIERLGDHGVARGHAERGGRVPRTLCHSVATKRCVVMMVSLCFPSRSRCAKTCHLRPKAKTYPRAHRLA